MPEYPIHELAQDISRCLTPGDFDHAAQVALKFFDDLNQHVIAQRGVTLACCEGCGICCSLRVDVFAHEVFLIARYIRTQFSAVELANLMRRLTAHVEEVTPLTPFEHATRNVPCPLLSEGRCTVYPVRPHSCRRHHSQDLPTCQYTYDHPTDLESPAAHDRELYRTLTAAMQQNIDVYFQQGFDVTIYELGTALYEALSNPERRPCWSAHEQAFFFASVTPAQS